MTKELHAKRVLGVAMVLVACGAMLTGCAHTHHANQGKPPLSGRAHALQKAQVRRQAELAARAATLLQKAASVRAIRFVEASPVLLARCSETAKVVGYAVPCPTRVPAGLVAFGGRPGCELQIIGSAKPCPNTVFHWRGWVIRSSTTADEHLVLTASPRIVRSAAKIVNGPTGNPVKPFAASAIAASAAGECTSSSSHRTPTTAAPSRATSCWSGTVGRHTYAAGFHDISTLNETLALDLTLARDIRLVSG